MFSHPKIHAVALTLVPFQYSLCPLYYILHNTGFQTFHLGNNKEVVLNLLLVGTKIQKQFVPLTDNLQTFDPWFSSGLETPTNSRHFDKVANSLMK